jgi:hypothetical protein
MTELPIACTLSAAEQARRVASSKAVMTGSLLDSAITERGASMRFRIDAEADLRRLIAAESECCPFLDFELRTEDGHLQLNVEGPAEARPVIVELFGLESTPAR